MRHATLPSEQGLALLRKPQALALKSGSQPAEVAAATAAIILLFHVLDRF
jgi:hypothetical protein